MRFDESGYLPHDEKILKKEFKSWLDSRSKKILQHIIKFLEIRGYKIKGDKIAPNRELANSIMKQWNKDYDIHDSILDQVQATVSDKISLEMIFEGIFDLNMEDARFQEDGYFPADEIILRKEFENYLNYLDANSIKKIIDNVNSNGYKIAKKDKKENIKNLLKNHWNKNYNFSETILEKMEDESVVENESNSNLEELFNSLFIEENFGEEDDLENYSKPDLEKIARDLNITGRSLLTKDNLIKKIKQKQLENPQETSESETDSESDSDSNSETSSSSSSSDSSSSSSDSDTDSDNDITPKDIASKITKGISIVGDEDLLDDSISEVIEDVVSNYTKSASEIKKDKKNIKKDKKKIESCYDGLNDKELRDSIEKFGLIIKDNVPRIQLMKILNMLNEGKSWEEIYQMMPKYINSPDEELTLVSFYENLYNNLNTNQIKKILKERDIEIPFNSTREKLLSLVVKSHQFPEDCDEPSCEIDNIIDEFQLTTISPTDLRKKISKYYIGTLPKKININELARMFATIIFFKSLSTQELNDYMESYVGIPIDGTFIQNLPRNKTISLIVDMLTIKEKTEKLNTSNEEASSCYKSKKYITSSDDLRIEKDISSKKKAKRLGSTKDIVNTISDEIIRGKDIEPEKADVINKIVKTVIQDTTKPTKVAKISKSKLSKRKTREEIEDIKEIIDQTVENGKVKNKILDSIDETIDRTINKYVGRKSSQASFQRKSSSDMLSRETLSEAKSLKNVKSAKTIKEIISNSKLDEEVKDEILDSIDETIENVINKYGRPQRSLTSSYEELPEELESLSEEENLNDEIQSQYIQSDFGSNYAESKPTQFKKTTIRDRRSRSRKSIAESLARSRASTISRQPSTPYSSFETIAPSIAPSESYYDETEKFLITQDQIEQQQQQLEQQQLEQQLEQPEFVPAAQNILLPVSQQVPEETIAEENIIITDEQISQPTLQESTTLPYNSSLTQLENATLQEIEKTVVQLKLDEYTLPDFVSALNNLGLRADNYDLFLSKRLYACAQYFGSLTNNTLKKLLNIDPLNETKSRGNLIGTLINKFMNIYETQNTAIIQPQVIDENSSLINLDTNEISGDQILDISNKLNLYNIEPRSIMNQLSSYRIPFPNYFSRNDLIELYSVFSYYYTLPEKDLRNTISTISPTHDLIQSKISDRLTLTKICIANSYNNSYVSELIWTNLIKELFPDITVSLKGQSDQVYSDIYKTILLANTESVNQLTNLLKIKLSDLKTRQIILNYTKDKNFLNIDFYQKSKSKLIELLIIYILAKDLDKKQIIELYKDEQAGPRPELLIAPLEAPIREFELMQPQEEVPTTLSYQQIQSLPDFQLFKYLKALGLNPGPVNLYTRDLYEKKLFKKLLEKAGKNLTVAKNLSLTQIQLMSDNDIINGLIDNFGFSSEQVKSMTRTEANNLYFKSILQSTSSQPQVETRETPYDIIKNLSDDDIINKLTQLGYSSQKVLGLTRDQADELYYNTINNQITAPSFQQEVPMINFPNTAVQQMYTTNPITTIVPQQEIIKKQVDETFANPIKSYYNNLNAPNYNQENLFNTVPINAVQSYNPFIQNNMIKPITDYVVVEKAIDQNFPISTNPALNTNPFLNDIIVPTNTNNPFLDTVGPQTFTDQQPIQYTEFVPVQNNSLALVPYNPQPQPQVGDINAWPQKLSQYFPNSATSRMKRQMWNQLAL